MIDQKEKRMFGDDGELTPEQKRSFENLKRDRDMYMIAAGVDSEGHGEFCKICFKSMKIKHNHESTINETFRAGHSKFGQYYCQTCNGTHNYSDNDRDRKTILVTSSTMAGLNLSREDRDTLDFHMDKIELRGGQLSDFKLAIQTEWGLIGRRYQTDFIIVGGLNNFLQVNQGLSRIVFEVREVWELVRSINMRNRVFFLGIPLAPRISRLLGDAFTPIVNRTFHIMMINVYYQVLNELHENVDLRILPNLAQCGTAKMEGDELVYRGELGHTVKVGTKHVAEMWRESNHTTWAEFVHLADTPRYIMYRAICRFAMKAQMTPYQPLRLDVLHAIRGFDKIESLETWIQKVGATGW